MPEQTVAFIGLGNMGGPMAANLVKAGYSVTGFDPAETARATAVENGITPAGSAPDAVGAADIVFTMLPSAPYVMEVWQDIVPAARPGTLIADCSTIDVATARDIHALAEANGLRSVDAPVSGGVGGAKSGSLTFMLGGAEEAMAAVEPLLAAMGRKTVRCGTAGAGQAAKICNNMILGVSMIAVSEAFVLAEKLGLSHEAFFDIASTSSGQCWSLTTYCPVPGLVPTSPANNDYRPGAPASMLVKDLRLSQAEATRANAATPLGAHATQLYEAFASAGHADEDFSAIVRYLRTLSADGQSNP
ncbi:MAG: 3-hydroxyisobutyrate dehydrogenase [Rhodospirillaceae bacterium]|nr:3-hydroxyisobutyrate dehydrogenase [Rhodospirillaceae bacterium]